MELSSDCRKQGTGVLPSGSEEETLRVEKTLGNMLMTTCNSAEQERHNTHGNVSEDRTDEEDLNCDNKIVGHDAKDECDVDVAEKTVSSECVTEVPSSDQVNAKLHDVAGVCVSKKTAVDLAPSQLLDGTIVNCGENVQNVQQCGESSDVRGVNEHPYSVSHKVDVKTENAKHRSTSPEMANESTSSHRELPSDVDTPKHGESGFGRCEEAARTSSSNPTLKECSHNTELLSALLKPEPTLAKSDSLKTVVNTMVEVGMWMPLNETSSILPVNAKQNHASNGEEGSLVKDSSIQNGLKESSNLASDAKDCGGDLTSPCTFDSTPSVCSSLVATGTSRARIESFLKSPSSNDTDEVSEGKSKNASVDEKGGKTSVDSSQLLGGWSNTSTVLNDAFEPHITLESSVRLSASEQAGTTMAVSHPAVTSTGLSSVDAIFTTIIREKDRSSPIVVWKAETDVDQAGATGKLKNGLSVQSDTNHGVKKKIGNKKAFVNKDDCQVLAAHVETEAHENTIVRDSEKTITPVTSAAAESKSAETLPRVASDPCCYTADPEVDQCTGDSAVTPVMIIPVDPDSCDAECANVSEDSVTLTTTSAASLPQICQVFGGITGSKLRQLHTQGSITASSRKSRQQHSLLKSILRKANKSCANEESQNENGAKGQEEGGSDVTMPESGEEQSLVYIKEEKQDTGYEETPSRMDPDEQLVKYVTYKKIQPHPGTECSKASAQSSAAIQPAHTRDIHKGKKTAQTVSTKASAKNVVSQQATMTSLLQNPATGAATTVLLPKGILPNVGGVVGKVTRNGTGNIQIAVPIIMSKTDGQMTGQPPLLFTFATLPKLSTADSTSIVSVATGARPSVASTTGPKSVESGKSKTTSPKYVAGSHLETDYGRYLRNVVKFKSNIKELKDTDVKYTCPMPAASLFLSHKMNRMFVCRGCDSTFHKQSSLSEHQLRRTLSLRYSCHSDCHVLFYNVCQLILHTRTHPPLNPDWQKKVEVSGLPEDLLYKSDGDIYSNIKRAIYKAAGMENKLEDNEGPEEKVACSSDQASEQPQEKKQSQREQRHKSVSTSQVDHAYGRTEKKQSRKSASQSNAIRGALCTDQRVNTLADKKPVICTECGLMFKTRADLMMHMISYGSSESLCLCKTCPVILRSKCAQSAHARIHKNSVPYVCPECGQVIHGSHNVFWKHLHVKCAHHIRQVLFQCKFCQREFRDLKRLVLHTTNQHSTKFHKCQLCPMAFKIANGVAEHAKANHSGKVSQKIIYKCPFCVAVYRDDTYGTHIEEHLAKAPPKVVYKCNACNKSYEKRSLCISHMTQAHKFYFNHNEMCHICGMDFRLVSSLLQHQCAEHPNIADLDDALTRCLKRSGIISSDESASLASPARAASPSDDEKQQPSDRPLTVLDIKEEPTDDDEEGEEGLRDRKDRFHCERCQMTMPDAQLYKQHMAKHKFMQKKRILGQGSDGKVGGLKRSGDQSKDLVLKIKIPKLASSSANDGRGRENETKTFTKQVPGAPDPEPLYYCTECNRAFYLEEGLASHLKKEHNQDRQFPCHLCGKTYHDQSALRLHVKKLHEGWSKDKPYVCWICQEKDIRRNFPKRVHLIKHISKEHKIARNLIDYSKMPDFINDSSKMDGSPNRMSPSGIDGEQDTLSDRQSEVDIPPVKRLKLEGETCFSCAKCSFVTEDRSTFVSHIKRHQPSKLSDAKLCLECGLSFTVTQSLKRHLLLVHQIRNFDKYMQESGIDLVSQPEEEEVILPKRMANPQPDKICKPRGFNDVVKQYVYKRNQKQNENDLECKVCYKSYDDELELRAHMRTHGMAYIRSSRRLDDV
ncbi:hypothetical protein LSH36_148g02082 [Paralvinella palmiformis]|uniref:C2H2-type domain-containing protein n=1 Tax=Paralvinella palmiformis TaxID=53620 RepID=A0AAD9JUR5_9ANNE|nr:hypothetical protein LSH36_148g02082 [Paralvinella palmiformis]